MTFSMLSQLTENEIFQLVCDFPEDVTDYIMEGLGR